MVLRGVQRGEVIVLVSTSGPFDGVAEAAEDVLDLLLNLVDEVSVADGRARPREASRPRPRWP